jgi:hypothetical protein
VSHEERAFLSQIRDALDASADAIDTDTRMRLRAGRARALGAARSRTRWLPIAGFATAAALVGIAVWRAGTTPGPAAPGPAPQEPIAVQRVEPVPVAAAEDLDLYLDLEFYTWLAEEGDAG